MTPIVNGNVHTFAQMGLYDGLFLMGDAETVSYWDHITGECVYGPLQGHRLEVGQLHHLTAAQTLAAYPEAQIAISKMPLWQRLMGRIQRFGAMRKNGVLPPRFRGSMGEADERLPRMEMGLGIWTNKTQRYYPMHTLKQAGEALWDQMDGRDLLIYLDPATHTPTAVYTPKQPFHRHDDQLQFADGSKIADSLLVMPDGATQRLERPQQLFTRWYGFAYTFPGCEIYAK